MGHTKPSLDGIPIEMFHKITEDLEIGSFRNLRLACRILSDNIWGSHFKSFFESQQTDLTYSSLERLCQIASHPKLRTAVHTLTVLAVIYDTSELDRMLKTQRKLIFEQQGVFSMTTEPQATEAELIEAQATRKQLLALMHEQAKMRRDESDVQLLAAALNSLGKLAHLAVEAAVVQEPGRYGAASSTREWHPVWICASQAYFTTSSAIACSGVAINTFVLYKNSLRCSVPTSDVGEHMPKLEAADFTRAAKHIRSISLSVSTKVETDYQKIANARANLSEIERAYYEAGMGTNAGLLSPDDPAATAEENYPGIARLLKHTPNLEELDLHLYRTLKGSISSYAKVFSYIAEEVALSSLRQCALRGIPCSEASLLLFLHRHNALTTLELRDSVSYPAPGHQSSPTSAPCPLFSESRSKIFGLLRMDS